MCAAGQGAWLLAVKLWTLLAVALGLLCMAVQACVWVQHEALLFRLSGECCCCCCCCRLLWPHPQWG